MTSRPLARIALGVALAVLVASNARVLGQSPEELARRHHELSRRSRRP